MYILTHIQKMLSGTFPKNALWDSLPVNHKAFVKIVIVQWCQQCIKTNGVSSIWSNSLDDNGKLSSLSQHIMTDIYKPIFQAFVEMHYSWLSECKTVNGILSAKHTKIIHSIRICHLCWSHYCWCLASCWIHATQCYTKVFSEARHLFKRVQGKYDGE